MCIWSSGILLHFTHRVSYGQEPWSWDKDCVCSITYVIRLCSAVWKDKLANCICWLRRVSIVVTVWIGTTKNTQHLCHLICTFTVKWGFLKCLGVSWCLCNCRIGDKAFFDVLKMTWSKIYAVYCRSIISFLNSLYFQNISDNTFSTCQ